MRVAPPVLLYSFHHGRRALRERQHEMSEEEDLAVLFNKSSSSSKTAKASGTCGTCQKGEADDFMCGTSNINTKKILC